MRRAHFTHSVLAIAALCANCSTAREPSVRAVQIVGASELIRVDEAALDFIARLDEVGRVSSIHALDIRVVDASPDMFENVGRLIRFRVVNERGEERQLATRVEGVTGRYGGSGNPLRYSVSLRLRLGRIERAVPVALLDRSSLPYRLVVGRDWLGDDLVVDARRTFAD
jgi:hypothetical protein